MFISNLDYRFDRIWTFGKTISGTHCKTRRGCEGQFHFFKVFSFGGKQVRGRRGSSVDKMPLVAFKRFSRYYGPDSKPSLVLFFNEDILQDAKVEAELVVSVAEKIQSQKRKALLRWQLS